MKVHRVCRDMFKASHIDGTRAAAVASVRTVGPVYGTINIHQRHLDDAQRTSCVLSLVKPVGSSSKSSKSWPLIHPKP